MKFTITLLGFWFGFVTAMNESIKDSNETMEASPDYHYIMPVLHVEHQQKPPDSRKSGMVMEVPPAYNPSFVAPPRQHTVYAEAKLSSEKVIFDQIFKDPNNRILPKYNTSEPIIITMDLKLYQILEVNEREQFMTLSLWVEQDHDNEFLHWNAHQFKINVLPVPKASELLWKPDIVLMNQMELDQDSTIQETTTFLQTFVREIEKVTDGGSVISQMVPFSRVVDTYPMIAKFSCSFNTFKFPFDEQSCTLWFSSWGYDTNRLKIQPRMKDAFRSDMLESEEWDVLSFVQLGRDHKYNCCPSTYSVFTAEIRLRRKPLYYIINIFLPTLIVAEVAIIGFFTPSSSDGGRGEKVNLGMGTMVAIVVMLLIVTEKMPDTSNYIPLAGVFFMAILCLILLGIVLSSFILHIEKKAHKKKSMNKTVKKIFLGCVGPMLCFRRRKQKHNVETDSVKSGLDEFPNKVGMAVNDHMTLNSLTKEPITPRSPTQQYELRPLFENKFNHLTQILKEIHNHINKNDENETECLNPDYCRLADILDRLCLLVFTLILGITAIVLCIVGYSY